MKTTAQSFQLSQPSDLAAIEEDALTKPGFVHVCDMLEDYLATEAARARMDDERVFAAVFETCSAFLRAGHPAVNVMKLGYVLKAPLSAPDSVTEIIRQAVAAAVAKQAES